MYEDENSTESEQLEESNTETGAQSFAEPTAGIDYSKDFIWGSNQDEYIDES